MGAPVAAEEIFRALEAALQPDAALRQQAESHIHTAFCRPGCAVALLQIAGENRVDTGAQRL